MRKAVIDLGTNTFNLCIADVIDKEIIFVHSEKEGVALGMGGINDKIIHEDAMQRALFTLQHYAKVCKDYGVSTINAIGTSAVRDAINKHEFVARVYAESKINVCIISGEEEARFIHQGVAWTHDFNEEGVIMDIGGGSTEFILANNMGIQKLISLDIGLSRLIQLKKFNDPLTLVDIDFINSWFKVKTANLLSKFQTKVLIGASGSFETFYEIMNSKPFPRSYNAFELNINEVKKTCELLISSAQFERDLHPFIIPIRKKMAPFAALKTLFIIDLLGIEKIYVSPCALKEGVLLEKQ
jgi:exopolyphosphatase/guanosine-5'-triphosphate,3'-diphosphate pyrophosphatase